MSLTTTDKPQPPNHKRYTVREILDLLEQDEDWQSDEMRMVAIMLTHTATTYRELIRILEYTTKRYE